MDLAALRFGGALLLATLVACTAENPYYEGDGADGASSGRGDGAVDGPSAIDFAGSVRDFAIQQVDMSTAPLPDLSMPVPAVVTYIPVGAEWRYLDNGSNQRTAWRTIGFDDSNWKSGKAELGYGDGDEATVVSFGQNPARKHVTTYFRHVFNATGVARFRTLSLRVRRDDGIVVYLNGTEVYRNNMPGGAVAFNTAANGVAAGNDESAWQMSSPDPARLVKGPNVVAAEIHQANLTSSDISFDLELVARTMAP